MNQTITLTLSPFMIEHLEKVRADRIAIRTRQLLSDDPDRAAKAAEAIEEYKQADYDKLITLSILIAADK